MSIKMVLECEDCGRVRTQWVPVRFHYSDGCYTVLAIDEPKCRTCAEKKQVR